MFYLGIISILVLFSIGILGGILYLFYGKKILKIWSYSQLWTLFLSLLFKKKTKSIELKTIKTEENVIDSEYHSDNSSVIVTLLGNEYSPENLTELGTSLSLDKKIKVVNITEVPQIRPH